MQENKNIILLQARLYKILSLIFLFVGCLIFFIVYVKNIEGRLVAAFMELSTIALILFPFSPAIVLSIMAASSERKYIAICKKENATAPKEKEVAPLSDEPKEASAS